LKPFSICGKVLQTPYFFYNFASCSEARKVAQYEDCQPSGCQMAADEEAKETVQATWLSLLRNQKL
jgi:hypothetical protein